MNGPADRGGYSLNSVSAEFDDCLAFFVKHTEQIAQVSHATNGTLAAVIAVRTAFQEGGARRPELTRRVPGAAILVEKRT